MVCFRVQIWCGWAMTGNFEWFFDVLNHWLPFNERFEQNLTSLTRTEWRERGHTKARENEDGRELRTFKTILKWQKLGISGSIFSMDEMNVDATVAWGTVGSGSLDWKEIYSSEAMQTRRNFKRSTADESEVVWSTLVEWMSIFLSCCITIYWRLNWTNSVPAIKMERDLLE